MGTLSIRKISFLILSWVLIAFSTVITQEAYAQFSGIGVVVPTTALDVNGTGLFRNGNAAAANANDQLRFGFNGLNQNMHGVKTRHTSLAGLGNAIDFYLWDAGVDALDAVGSQHVMTLEGFGEGRVGIGTTSPALALDVNGAALIGGNGSVNKQGLQLVWNDANVGGAIQGISGFLNHRGLGPGGFVWSQTNDNVTFTEFMRITASGNLGIGTTSPGAKLGVAGRTITTDFTMTNGAANGYVLQSDGTGAATWADPASLSVTGDDLGNHIATQDLNMDGNWIGGDATGGEGIFVQPTGDVGIGTSSPSAQLSVTDANGSTNYAGNVQVDIANLSFLTNQFSVVSPDYDLAMGGLGLYANYTLVTDRRKLGGVYGQIGSNQSGHLIFTTMSAGSELERMTITENGRLGLNTNDPSARLDVDGNARIRTLTSGAATDFVVTADANGNLRSRTAAEVITAGGGVTDNIYSADGTLAGNRAVTFGANDLNFDANTLVVSGNDNRLGVGTAGPLAKVGINAAGEVTALKIDTDQDNRNTVTVRRTNNANEIGIGFQNSALAYGSAIFHRDQNDSDGLDEALSIATIGNQVDPALLGETVTFKNDGTVRLHDYGVGNNDDASPARILGVQADGDVVEVTSASFSENIYNTNGTLSGNRVVTQNNFDLNFDANTLVVSGDDNRVGIGTAVPASQFAVGNNVVHDAAFNYSGAVSTIFDSNNNGGNSPNGTKDILHLVREGIASQAFANKATFAIGRYENVGTSSRSQLDIKLTDGSFNSHNTVMSLRSSGDVGIGTTGATNMLDIMKAPRTGTHATGRPLYVTGNIGAASNGIEFRFTNGTQGIGFGYNTIYAAGSVVNQPINLLPKGTSGVGIGAANNTTAKLKIVNNVGTGASFDNFTDYQVLLFQNSAPQNSYGIGVESNTLAFNSNVEYDFNVNGVRELGLTNAGLTVTDRTTTRNFTMTNGATNGYVLQSDGVGNASWVSSSSLSVTGDNLGNHTATTNLDMNSRNINATTGDLNFGATARQMINLWNSSYGIGVQSNTQYFRTGNHFAWYRGGSHNNGTFNAGGGVVAMTLNSANKLDVNGEVEFTNNLLGNGKRAITTSDNWLRLNNSNQFTNGIFSPGSMRIDGAVIFNETGNNVDFRVEGDTEPNLLRVDASADAVGIGTPTPRGGLEISKTRTIGQTVRPLSEAVSSASSDNYNLVLSNSDNRTIGLVSGFSASSGGFDTYFQARNFSAGGSGYNILLNPAGGNVGIGTVTPRSKLSVIDVNNSSNYTGNLQVDIAELTFRTGDFNLTNPNFNVAMGGLGFYAAFTADFDRRKLGGVYGQIGSNQSGHLIFTTMDSGSELERMTITEGGNVGIGTNAPSQRLHVVGNIFATGTVTTSDSTLKTRILPIDDDATEAIKKLNPVSYKWKQHLIDTAGYDDKSQIGFLAQEVRKIIPEAVAGAEGTDLGIDYNKITPIIVKAMQEQQVTIETQEQRLLSQQEQISKLNAELEAIKDLLRK